MTYKLKGFIDDAEDVAEVGKYEFVLLLLGSLGIFFSIVQAPYVIVEMV